MRKSRILVVDDQEINLILIEKTLRGLEIELVRAYSGEEALKILSNDKEFDIILMDIQMSGLTGFDTVRLIKNDESLVDIPVIFITAYYNQSEHIGQGYALGAFDYIVKPIDKNTLIGKVKLYINLESEKRQNKEKNDQLAEMNRSLNILNECNTALIYSETEIELLNSYCTILTDFGNYPLVWAAEVKIDEVTQKENFSIIAISDKGIINTNKALFEENDFYTDLCPQLNNGHNSIIEFNCIENNCGLCRALTYNGSIYFFVKKIRIFDKQIFFIINYIDKDELSSYEKQLLTSVVINLKYGMNALETKRRNINFQLELNREKEELSKTLASITDGVIFANLNGKIVYCNPASYKTLGFSEVELKSTSIFEIFKILNDSNVDLFNPIDMIQNYNKHEIQKFQLNVITQKEKKMILQCSLAPIYKGETQTLEAVTFSFQDITEQIKLTNDLALSQKMQSVGQLAAGIAHEINTPLQFIGDNNFFLKDASKNVTDYYNYINSLLIENDNNIVYQELINKIRAYADNLSLDFLINEMQKAIDSNLDGIQRVNRIVTAMKNFAHPSEKTKTLSNINETIETTSVITRNEWKYSAELELLLEPDLPLVSCVLDEINQVLLNMIINAVHTIKDCIGQKKYELGLIQIKTYHTYGFVYIEIKDNGAGISKEILNRIYDPFFTTKPVGMGTGQGLAISHDIIVNKHQGKIDITSEVGVGTTFIISLPLIGE